MKETLGKLTAKEFYNSQMRVKNAEEAKVQGKSGEKGKSETGSFDPNLHEALGMIQHPSADPNTVVRVERKGYLYHDKRLRPAQVLVAAG